MLILYFIYSTLHIKVYSIHTKAFHNCNKIREKAHIKDKFANLFSVRADLILKDDIIVILALFYLKNVLTSQMF